MLMTCSKIDTPNPLVTTCQPHKIWTLTLPILGPHEVFNLQVDEVFLTSSDTKLRPGNSKMKAPEYSTNKCWNKYVERKSRRWIS